MRILLINPPYRLTGSRLPLGLAYIGASLKKEGYNLQAIDIEAFKFKREQVIDIVKQLDPDIVCTGGMITTYNFIKFLCAQLKKIKPQLKIIVGGSLVTPIPKLFLENTEADIGVIGEGEQTIVELIRVIQNSKDLNRVDGIIFKNNGYLIQTKPRQPINDLDSLSFPSRELFPVKKIYVKRDPRIKGKRNLGIITGRGCPYECTFCYKNFMGKVRLRSVGNIIEELKELKDRYKLEFFNILDDLFFVNRSRVIEFCERLIMENLQLNWRAAARINLMDRQIIKLVRKAGCCQLAYGIESGNQYLLDRMKKKITVQQVLETIRITSEEGIKPGGTFILGMPGETRETVVDTVRLYKEINKYRDHANKFFFATPYPGTALYKEMKQKGRIKDEIKFIEQLSVEGDATNFVINCTDSFSDEELIRLKEEIENEVVEDFFNKHKFLRLLNDLKQITGINYFIYTKRYIKRFGLVETIKKILCKFRVLEKKNTIK